MITTGANIANQVALSTGLVARQATEATHAVLEAIAQAILRGDDVRILSFGNFSLVRRNAREGRNPKTGEKIDIAASVGVSFRPSRRLKESLNPRRLVGPDRGRTEAGRKQA